MTSIRQKAIKTILIIIVILVVMAGIIFGTGAWYIIDKLSKVNYVDISAEDIDINEGVNTGYRNIVLLGTDTRSNTLDEGRSDCIIIVSINEKSKEIKLISVYRDTYLQIQGHGLDKVTHAYAYGGARS